jgi:mitochondrial import inner membrane translocase subunit TIM22
LSFVIDYSNGEMTIIITATSAKFEGKKNDHHKKMASRSMERPQEGQRRPNFYGDAAKNLYLPFYKQITLPPPPDQIPVIPSLVQESCAFKIVTGGVMGAVLGVGLGLFMGAMGGDMNPIQIINGREVPQAPVREQLRAGYKGFGSKAIGWSKNFGVLTALFGGVECLIEKYRGKHDGWNPVLGGCAAGATLSARAGPTAACIGCAGFAGFSFVMDKIMGPH